MLFDTLALPDGEQPSGKRQAKGTDMTRNEMQKELEARYAREYQLIRESTLAREAGEDVDPIEHAIAVNASRIDWLQAQLNNSAVCSC